MIDISKHITMHEATDSAFAGVHGITNIPKVPQIMAMQHLAQTCFEPLRAHFGDKPIPITSFYRCHALNKAIGGAQGSQHVTGEAIDFKGTAEMFEWIRKNLPFDQLIWEFGGDQPAWIHLSLTKGTNRYQVLKSITRKTGPKYIKL
jgi:hypothetical protein